MYYALIGLLVLVSVAFGLYSVLKRNELETNISALQKEIQERERRSSVELKALKAELAKLDRYSHIPGVFEKAKAAEREAAARLERSQQRVYEILQAAAKEAGALKTKLISDAKADAEAAKEARRTAEQRAKAAVEEANKEAKEITSQARKEARQKTQKVEETLSRATTYALEIRENAEKRAREIGGKAYEALKRHDFYEAAARAMENVVSKYGGTYMVPGAEMLDELAEEYGFHKAGERLQVARERTRVMEKNGTAATCNYPEGWKRDYAINFVLSAFNGKVDSLLVRLKPANKGKLIQEIKDAYALVNRNGEVFRNARIQEEYLDARLEELKWAAAVQRVKEKEREEQRAIREQIREEERARKEYERAVKQAQRDESMLTQALEKARREFEAAAGEDRAKYETQLQDLADKLKAAEEKNRRALSMAQQTRCGHVYVISNIGSFGEDVYKIGLTRRLEPLDRVRELGDASVPFAFDVHAMIYSEDAPALEAALHRRFVQSQVNKVNRRKEFFRLKLQDIRGAMEEMKHDVKWTLAAEARDYRETLAMERQMREDPEYQKRWTEEQSAHVPTPAFDDDEDDEGREDEGDLLIDDGQPVNGIGATLGYTR